jgi:hypothetical protein
MEKVNKKKTVILCLLSQNDTVRSQPTQGICASKVAYSVNFHWINIMGMTFEQNIVSSCFGTVTVSLLITT